MLLTLDLLDMMDPPAELADLERYFPFIEQYCPEYGIDTPARFSAFVAQIVVESNHFKTIKENLNYSAQGLANTWAKFSATGARGGPPNELAQRIARNPELIANHAYANRYGNRGPESGDGWKYAGKGLKQVTFHDNYLEYGLWSSTQAAEHPEFLLMPRHAVLSGVWYWESRKLSELADYDDEEHFHQISYKINGGWNGKMARFEAWGVAREACRHV
jgi:putative chitinase